MRKEDLLSIHPTLATEAGIEAACIHAVLAQQLSAERETLCKLTQLTADLQTALPFLTPEQVLAGLAALVERELLVTSEGTDSATPVTLRHYAADGQAQQTPVPPQGPMTLQWMPPPHVTQVLGNYGISEEFWTAQLDPFRVYWMERGGQRVWGSQFLGWVRRGWELAQQAEAETTQQPIETAAWQPSARLCAAIEQTGVAPDFPLAQLEKFQAALPRCRGGEERLELLFRNFVQEEWDMQQLAEENKPADAAPPAHPPEPDSNPSSARPPAQRTSADEPHSLGTALSEIKF